MTTTIETWDGDDWENHVGRLLQDRHGATNVQKVPAKHFGDGGLDYYCTSETVVYQCYAVQEPVDIATRALKQKTKITTDIGKLCKADGLAAKLFKSKPVSRWILAVPKHDSQEVNSHAAIKAEEVRSMGLAHRQQEAAEISIGGLLKEAARIGKAGAQVIIATSERLETVKELSAGLPYELIVYGGRLIGPIPDER
ncbi:MAG: hypothetical protein A2790_20160 [Phenylobacterium sp. RIFCSPHIGHO2_01_FULL_69_31]|uniref:hypothetical protein n=1 Tax=Phenylobacterium sp. RIFCSPHIGHO2_01_FULL_69_31 TaxID=1801944 RepID=UPI0008BB4DAC|nr:hypothetical protein [Phenylobacterium sp. RIFCSPHIGHO2_01_FULL_69_31]OHB26281.1 MAG: hypothetical protein A2790_20160 [Phenylobacterium sp. RIFCSPHIGHO2_01_FULL_69_31]